MTSTFERPLSFLAHDAWCVRRSDAGETRS
jgi:hypothetical protein